MNGAGFDPWLEELESLDVGRARRAFETLYRAHFHTHRLADRGQWDRLYDAVLVYVSHENPQLASSALHYVWVILWSELGPPYDTHTREDQGERFRSRIPPLLTALSRMVVDRDALLRITDSLVHAESMVQLEPDPRFSAWARSMAEDEVTPSILEIAYEARRRPWHEVREHLQAALDHENVLLRAYAARTISEHYLDASSPLSPPLHEIVARVTRKELERPGIAGPLLSPFYPSALARFAKEAQVVVDDWIMTILERRSGDEPDTLPCSCGIDFFAHEVFGGRADQIVKLLDLGLEGLAIAAATEIDDHVPGLAPVLVTLGHLPDEEACRCASWHLAYHYRELHPAGAARGFVRHHTLEDGVDLFVNLKGESQSPYSATVYARASFSDIEAHEMLDRVLPAKVRGALIAHPLSPQRVPGVFVLGQRAYYVFENGAVVAFRGDVEARRWDRIMVRWKGDRSAFTPEDVARG